LENPTTIVQGDRVTHLVYDVSRCGPPSSAFRLAGHAFDADAGPG
jgi:hypothetical protein